MPTYLDTFIAYAERGLDERTIDALNSRGVSDEQIATYRVGYLGGSVPELPPEAAPFLEWLNTGTRAKDTLVYPLTNALGEIQGVQVRPRERGQKGGYADFFLTQAEPVFFGLGQAMEAIWQEKAVWLVEGVHDLFPIQRHFPAVLAILSVKVTPGLIRLLRRMVDTVYPGLDMDTTGRVAAARFQYEYRRQFTIRPVQYPSIRYNGREMVKDPGDLWEARGDGFVGEFVQQVVRGVF